MTARRILMGRHAQKTFHRLRPEEQGRLRKALKMLETDPFTPRPGADIKRLAGTRGRQDLFRLRVGNRRVVYAVEGNEVLVTDLFERGRGYEA